MKDEVLERCGLKRVFVPLDYKRIAGFVDIKVELEGTEKGCNIKFVPKNALCNYLQKKLKSPREADKDWGNFEQALKLLQAFKLPKRGRGRPQAVKLSNTGNRQCIIESKNPPNAFQISDFRHHVEACVGDKAKKVRVVYQYAATKLLKEFRPWFSKHYTKINLSPEGQQIVETMLEKPNGPQSSQD
jgi:hypothetical protein